MSNPVHLSVGITMLWLACGSAAAQPNVCNGAALTGIVRDSSGANVIGATVALEDATEARSGSDGRFRFACAAAGAHRLHIVAQSFAAVDREVSASRVPGDILITLRPESVDQSIDVQADTARGVDNTETGASRTLAGDDLKALADDPDDLLRQLQQLAAGAGGNPADTLITVDGFQDPSKLPPKSSIAYIKVNPDLFSAEYQEPPYEGARVEVYTKPGQPRYHGSLFMTYGRSSLNARDPFSTAKGTIGKQRYGFDLSGPVRKAGSDFALSLEHRSIDNVGVVNAVSLGSNGDAIPVNATVNTPQRLWEGSARAAWQWNPKNSLTATYTANVNHLTNVGVGGTALQESGYGEFSYEHTLRALNVSTLSANLMHEARFSFSWVGDVNTPNSSAIPVQVAGAFSGGGSELGSQANRSTCFELYDDAIWTHGAHTLKAGVNWRLRFQRRHLTQDFNGLYTFGGGIAPVLDSNGNAVAGNSTTISGLEQYRRALLNLPGGAATAYTGVTGDPEVDFNQSRESFFAQESWKIKPNLVLSYGLRYYAQNDPLTRLNFAPRLGIAWSPDKKQTWTIKLHSGMFNGQYDGNSAAQILRLDGMHRVSNIIYSPVFGNPYLNATPIRTIRTFAPGFGDAYFAEQQMEVDHSLRGGWNVQGTFYWLRVWNDGRTRNINAPLNGSPTGPRPGPANLNILQAQNSGSMKGDIEFVSVEQHTLKPLTIFLGYVRLDLRGTTDNNLFFTPQSSYTDAGEYGRRTNNSTHQMFGSTTLHLPRKVDLSTEYYLNSGRPYNITTGFDNNGDGDFNDRPTYARQGDPNAIATRYGLLIASGGTGVFPRNAGTTPWAVHLDANLSHTFILTPHAAKDRLQTLAVNLRSANVLNHTDVTQVGSVLGSPLFGLPYQADTGRRVEAGLRYSF